MPRRVVGAAKVPLRELVRAPPCEVPHLIPLAVEVAHLVRVKGEGLGKGQV